MTTWTRQPQEREGSYFFSGQFLVTNGVDAELSLPEILWIYQDVQRFVWQQNGADYLQVYQSEEGKKLFLIDQLNQEMLNSGRYRKEDNHCTLLFAHEY